MNRVAIAFICDAGYVMQTAVAITSLIDNKKIDTYYEVYIFAMGIDETQECMFNQLGDATTAIHVKKQEINKYRGTFKENHSVYRVATDAALLKFDLAELLPCEDKVIYLDGDIIVKKDLAELYETKLNDYYAAVVRDVPQVLFDVPLIDVGTGKDYFNSGVMVLNLSLLRENNIKSILIETKKNLQDDNLMDQNVFNIVFQRKIMQLPIKYNVLYANLLRNWEKHDVLNRLNKIYKSSYCSLNDILQNAVIIHYSSKDKPWRYFDAPGADEWLYYYMRSPYSSQVLKRDSLLSTGSSMQSNDDIINIFPIVFATDINYVPYTIVAIQSIINTACPEDFYEIYILHSDLSEVELDLLQSLEKENLKIKFVNVEKMNALMDKEYYVRAHYSKEMYYRWFIPEILPQYKKVLYLDCDIVVLKNLKELFENDLGNYIIGGVCNVCDSLTELRIESNFNIPISKYINSGVLLFNTREFILNKTKNECIRLIKILSKDILTCPDQDIINIACQNKIKLLDDVWNFQWHHQWDEDNRKIDVYVRRFEKAKKNIGILHFTSGTKPWKNPDKPLAWYFWKFARMSPVYEKILYENIKRYEKLLPEAKVSKKNGKMKGSLIRRLVPPIIYGGILCYKEHGFRYTIKRTLEHFRIPMGIELKRQ